MTKALIVDCPNCKKQHNWHDSKPYSPFCSERCRLIDLGAWAAEEHRIPGEKAYPEMDSENKEFSA